MIFLELSNKIMFGLYTEQQKINKLNTLFFRENEHSDYWKKKKINKRFKKYNCFLYGDTKKKQSIESISK